MIVPAELVDRFRASFEELVAGFAREQGLDAGDLASRRFLSRSIAPHVVRLSTLFNGALAGQGPGKYWGEGGNPANRRMAYWLAFAGANQFRVASVLAELAALGFRWGAGDRLRAVELGAGACAGACGVASGGRWGGGIGLPSAGSFALVERDRELLGFGAAWAKRVFAWSGFEDWETREFAREIDVSGAEPFLPRGAGKFGLWVSSFFLNEVPGEPAQVAAQLADCWDRHLEDEGLVILVEPALQPQSRRLLEIRARLLEKGRFRVLLPCLGAQPCGALADPEDWCHEQVEWWRPSYLRELDRMTGLDHRALSFSYLVLVRSKRSTGELLPALGGRCAHRLVSPARKLGADWEFFSCGADGKRRCRVKASRFATAPARGSILLGTELRGAPEATRVESVADAIRLEDSE